MSKLIATAHVFVYMYALQHQSVYFMHCIKALNFYDILLYMTLYKFLNVKTLTLFHDIIVIVGSDHNIAWRIYCMGKAHNMS